MVTADRIVREAEKLIKVPFAHYGRSTMGLDCSGLIYMAFNRAGISIPKDDGDQYTPRWWRRDKTERFLNDLYDLGFYEVKDPQRGDLVTFRLFSPKVSVNHCGIMTNPEVFIHASCSRMRNTSGVRKESLRPRYIKRFHSFLRHKDVING